MSTPAAITVVIPSLNEEALVRASVSSALAGAADVVVVDGGSTDGTVDVRAARARGPNDTPNLPGLRLGPKLLTPGLGTAILVVVMALGGLLAARRVANTLSFGITGMNGTDGPGGDRVTAGLLLLASPLGLPVSATHVACGAPSGIGAANAEARWRMIAPVAGAWAVTLPIAAVLAGAAAAALV